MATGCGMHAIHASDHIVLLVIIEQHAAVDAITICGGADLHGQVATADNTCALDIQSGFAGVLFKEFFQAFNVEHG